MAWIKTEDRYPENDQHVKIKTWDDILDCEVEVSAIFFDYGEVKGWGITEKERQGRKIIAKPSHWKPILEEEIKDNG